jgi:hypothetical protein
MPDLEVLARRYLDDQSATASSSFMRGACLGHETRDRGITGLLRLWLGNSHHLWLWDYKATVHELDAAGFVLIRRALPGDSSDTAFLEVERADRWNDAFGIECRRA